MHRAASVQWCIGLPAGSPLRAAADRSARRPSRRYRHVVPSSSPFASPARPSTITHRGSNRSDAHRSCRPRGPPERLAPGQASEVFRQQCLPRLFADSIAPRGGMTSWRLSALESTGFGGYVGNKEGHDLSS